MNRDCTINNDTGGISQKIRHPPPKANFPKVIFSTTGRVSKKNAKRRI